MLSSRTGIEDEFRRRNREIGEVLAEARRRKQLSVTECANAIVTSRRRYSAIERGEVPVNAVELETLVRYLEVPVEEIWRDLSISATTRQLVVEIRPGKPVKLILELKG